MKKKLSIGAILCTLAVGLLSGGCGDAGSDLDSRPGQVWRTITGILDMGSIAPAFTAAITLGPGESIVAVAKGLDEREFTATVNPDGSFSVNVPPWICLLYFYKLDAAGNRTFLAVLTYNDGSNERRFIDVRGAGLDLGLIQFYINAEGVQVGNPDNTPVPPSFDDYDPDADNAPPPSILSANRIFLPVDGTLSFELVGAEAQLSSDLYLVMAGSTYYNTLLMDDLTPPTVSLPQVFYKDSEIELAIEIDGAPLGLPTYAHSSLGGYARVTAESTTSWLIEFEDTPWYLADWDYDDLVVRMVLTTLCTTDDVDGDGLDECQEEIYGTDPLLADTDGDGLDDGEEVLNQGTDPLATDTDGDLLTDGDEVLLYLTDPLSVDTDSDGIDDRIEAVVVACLQADDADSDGDGLIDGTAGGEDKNNDGVVDPGETDPCVFNAFWTPPIEYGPWDGYSATGELLRATTDDLNKDGFEDIVVANDTSIYTVLINQGDGSFSSTDYSEGSRLRDVVVIELAGDTIKDLALTDWNTSEVIVLEGNGDGTFVASFSISGISGAENMISGDFNKDGIVDLAACARNAQSVVVMLGNSGPGFNAPTSYSLNANCMGLAAGLLDSDSTLDIVTANWSSDSISILLGDGLGGFNPPTTLSAGNDNAEVALGDINDDSHLDAVITASAIDSVIILLGDGTGALTPFKTLAVADGAAQIRVADLNGDGLLDLINTNGFSPPGLSVILNYGAGHFSTPFYFHYDEEANALAISDFNPPSLPDIVTGHGDANEVRVMLDVMVDSDHDLISDGDEAIIGTNPSVPDTDGDGLNDGFERYVTLTDPLALDSDEDGMDDYWEVAYACVDPLAGDSSADPDGDGDSNLVEYGNSTDPCVSPVTDSDGDGLDDSIEDSICTDSLDPDTDSDGLCDGNVDVYNGSTLLCSAGEDLNLDGSVGASETDPCNSDTDGDLLTDGDEVLVYGTSPISTDTDSDGMPDDWEVVYSAICGLDPLAGDSAADPDGDLIDNITEYLGETDPCVADSATCRDLDGDGYLAGADCGTTVDCDDQDARRHPLALELCDCVDNQCPTEPGYGQADEGCPVDYIPMTFDGSKLLVDGGTSAVGRFDGHCVEIQLGQTAQEVQADGIRAWVRLVNRDEDEYMANAFVVGSSCVGCAGARFDNADVDNGETTHPIFVDGNTGAPAPIEGGGFTYVEDGNYDVSQSTEYWNEWGAPIQNVLLDKEPKQVLHPSLGTGSIIWDLGGQIAPYSFMATLQADWFPWNPTGADRLPGTMDDDPRYDFQDRSSYYVMLTDLGDNALFSTLTKVRKRWYRVGSYVRANVLAGWSADTDKAVLPVGTDFAVNIAIELPDRVENYKMGDYWQFSPYEYINQVSATIRYNPNVVMPGGSMTGNENYATGAQSICNNACSTNYDAWDYWQTGLGNNSGVADGWMAVANRLISTHTFSFRGSGTVYQTILGGKVLNKYVAGSTYPNNYLPVHHGHKGVAHFNVPVGGTLTATRYMENYSSALLVHEGPDAAPDIPLTLWYFQVVGPGGSEFWIDTYADWSFFQWIYTGSDLIPGGKTNDDASYCWPIGSCSPATAATVIEIGNEKTNYNILQSGEAASGYFDGSGNYIRGGVQQWPVFIVAQ